MSREEYCQEKALLAKNFFLQGYNCAQAVTCAFLEELSLELDQAARMVSSFGGGMGRLREVCGAVSGMFFVAGVACGYSDPNASEEKVAHYQRVQDLAALFRQNNGSIVCRELLAASCPQESSDHSPNAAPRTETYYKKRPCGDLVADAARFVAGLLYDQSCM